MLWTLKISHGQPGRPAVPKQVRELIRQISRENPPWGAPRLHGEFVKRGIEMDETSVSKYMVRHRKPRSPWHRAYCSG